MKEILLLHLYLVSQEYPDSTCIIVDVTLTDNAKFIYSTQ